MNLTTTTKRRLLGCVALLSHLGCSSSTQVAKLTTCDPADRQGAWLAKFTKVSGKCPDLPESLVTFDLPGKDGGATTSDGCTIKGELWSDGDCKVTRQVTCADKDFSANITVVSTYESVGKMTGTYSIASTDKVTGETCLGTYDMALTKK